MQQYYIGVMSGTSLDGVDLALMDFANPQGTLIATDFVAMPENLRIKLTALIHQSVVSLQDLGEMDHLLGHLYADAINQFLAKQAISAQQICAIGCHGQTIWHSPQGPYPFTMQIGDMNIVAIKTGINTIADFRRKDMALGGQGAPLVPAFHQAYFAEPNKFVAVLNIGGISNVSLLQPNQQTIGYDIGPGNTLLDQWIKQQQGKSYDKNGQWANTGEVNQHLLHDLMDEPFLQQPPPKSTGRELFNLAWLAQKCIHYPTMRPQDIQATLLAFTVRTIVENLKTIKTDLPRCLLVCGGGANNQLMMRKLQQGLPHWQVDTTEKYGLPLDYVEAAAFAWLAYQRIHHRPSNMPSVTGAKSAVSLGVIF